MATKNLPKIIQGGMGIGVSSVRLARTVSMAGHLGVVSGTGVATTLARRLQTLRGRKQLINAIKAFPFQAIANRILEKYVPKTLTQAMKDRYRPLPMPTLNQPEELTELMVVANFVEVYLAKKGHEGIIGINLLEKIQLPTLPSLYGAMLADVDYVLMGAGIPKHIPAVLDAFSKNEVAQIPIKIADETSNDITYATFDPIAFAKGDPLPTLKRPKFLAIIASTTLALHLSRSDLGAPDGFIVEMPIAGGHNAPPRGKLQRSKSGEPIYGERDLVDSSVLRTIGLPFWLAGGYGNHEAYLNAKSQGATGIQVGTAFAFSKESGMKRRLKERIITAVKKGLAHVKTDLRASPTGFPFKVVELSHTTGVDSTYKKRERICDIGYLREPYRKENGKIGYRCPSEPIDAYLKKGGKIEDTIGRKCLCNGLMSTLGFAQKHGNKKPEPPIVTAGDDLTYIIHFLKPGELLYSALDVIKHILGQSFLTLQKK